MELQGPPEQAPTDSRQSYYTALLSLEYFGGTSLMGRDLGLDSLFEM